MTKAIRKPDLDFSEVYYSSLGPVWIENIAPLYQQFSQFKKAGISNLRAYLEKYPHQVAMLASKIEILEVNQATVEMYGAKNSQELLGNLDRIMGSLDKKTFISALVAFWNQDDVINMEATHYTLDRSQIDVIISTKIPKFGSDKLVIPVSVTNITILNQQKKALTEALEELQTLRGIVPICSSCKMIRDDEGYWNQIEKYISERTGAKFSHGICPGCRVRLYPDLK